MEVSSISWPYTTIDGGAFRQPPTPSQIQLVINRQRRVVAEPLVFVDRRLSGGCGQGGRKSARPDAGVRVGLVDLVRMVGCACRLTAVAVRQPYGHNARDCQEAVSGAGHPRSTNVKRMKRSSHLPHASPSGHVDDYCFTAQICIDANCRLPFGRTRLRAVVRLGHRSSNGSRETTTGSVR